MRHLLLLTSAALFGATSALGTADLPSRATVDLTTSRAANVATAGTADLSMFEAGHLPAAAGGAAGGLTCMGQPVSPGGVGTSGDDVIVGTPRKDVIVAGAGNDVVRGRDGRDVICGGPGDDRLVGGRNPADWSTSRHGDRLSGGAGADRIVDRYGFADKLIGGSGDDQLASSNGIEHQVIGGPGADRLTSRDVQDNTMIGGRGPDVLTALSGSGYSRYHSGGPGRDVIDLGHTGDVGVGLTGDGDQLRIHGDASVVLSFGGSPVGVEVDMTTGTARRVGATPTDPADVITFLSPEGDVWVLYGSTHGDRVSGTEGHDMFFALAGDDTLYGNGGDDSLSGFAGDDRIDGGDGDDNADGGAGSDTCVNAESVEGCSP